MSRPRPSARHSVRADDGVGGGTTIYQLHTAPIRIAPRLEDAGAGGEETLFDRDLWPRTGDESPTPESSARVRFE